MSGRKISVNWLVVFVLIVGALGGLSVYHLLGGKFELQPRVQSGAAAGAQGSTSEARTELGSVIKRLNELEGALVARPPLAIKDQIGLHSEDAGRLGNSELITRDYGQEEALRAHKIDPEISMIGPDISAPMQLEDWKTRLDLSTNGLAQPQFDSKWNGFTTSSSNLGSQNDTGRNVQTLIEALRADINAALTKLQEESRNTSPTENKVSFVALMSAIGTSVTSILSLLGVFSWSRRTTREEEKHKLESEKLKLEIIGLQRDYEKTRGSRNVTPPVSPDGDDVTLSQI